MSWYSENGINDFQTSVTKGRGKNKVTSKYYYIHYHMNNIGKLIGQEENDGYRSYNQKLTEVFNKNLEDRAVKATKRHYANLLRTNAKSVNGNSEVTKFLDYILDPNLGDKVINNLDMIVKNKLQYEINEDWIAKTLALRKDRALKINGGGAYIKDDIHKTCEEVNKMLKIITSGLSIYNNQGQDVLFGIVELNGNNFNDLSQCGVYLQNQLLQFKAALENGKIFTINRKHVEAAMKGIETIAKALIAPKNSKNEDYTYNSLLTILTNQALSTDIGEVFCYRLDNKINEAINSAFVNFADKFKREGDNPVSFELYDSEGNLQIKEGGAAITEGKSEFQKIDEQAEGIKMSLSEITKNKYSGYLELKIGISNKFYTSRNITFNLNNTSSTNEFSVGGGINLAQALKITLSNPAELYLAYNGLAYEKETGISKKAIKSLKNAIAVRSLINLFSSRGGSSDFAGYIVINGAIVSVWDIIMYAIKNRITIGESGSNGIRIDFKLNNSFYNLHNISNFIERSKSINNKIKSSYFDGYIKPSKIINAVKNQTLQDIDF